ncbi:histidine kinase N-terminal domain-containing protein [Nigerium sp.]|uniref:sensor histidine kinase n=1 Tax=Nigerium sp. TaxID=2042655 RepID=UPI003221DB33
MLSMFDVIVQHTALNADETDWLGQLVRQWEILADLSFSDLILWVPDVDDNIFWAAAQIRPTTGPTALEEDVVGEDISYEPEHLVTEAYLSGQICHMSANAANAGIPVDVTAIPISRAGRVIGVVEIHTNRMGVRAPGALEDTYLETAQILRGMVWRGEFPMVHNALRQWQSPRVGDGCIRVNARGIITYASPNAISAHRRMGLIDDLEGENIGQVMKSLAGRVRMPMERAATFGDNAPWEIEFETEHASVLMRMQPLRDDSGPCGAFLMLRDTTDLRQRDRLLMTKDATIREIHHRVKNNLQTVSALLRLQARRTQSGDAEGALNDAQKRVGAIAVVHEILSQAFDTTVHFDDVADRLLSMVRDVATSQALVRFKREGTFGNVPADVATNLSLVLAEITQNAIEHGLQDGPGTLSVRPHQEDGRLVVEVVNDGEPLPEGFEIGKQTKSLGLSIVSTLVADMRGTFAMESLPGGAGTVARVEIPIG